jgi:hypothetical protein
VRANAAWALGILGAPASTVLALLQDKNPEVVQQALLAISRMPGEVDAGLLLPLLSQGVVGDRAESPCGQRQLWPSRGTSLRSQLRPFRSN